jgi:hypothetical protein
MTLFVNSTGLMLAGRQPLDSSKCWYTILTSAFGGNAPFELARLIRDRVDHRLRLGREQRTHETADHAR